MPLIPDADTSVGTPHSDAIARRDARSIKHTFCRFNYPPWAFTRCLEIAGIGTPRWQLELSQDIREHTLLP
jgi:hypothetical protein